MVKRHLEQIKELNLDSKTPNAGASGTKAKLSNTRKEDGKDFAHENLSPNYTANLEISSQIELDAQRIA
ncbi:hypothetical protein Taro_008942 [Colocasia esculenta]|uniref:Uncharacterized protein n=1 Tax=Colocasia esculenta TaxID=4460 RepID=A0A843U8K2_COLES|nr:hypothetical protein [Colocasia esculenta]